MLYDIQLSEILLGRRTISQTFYNAERPYTGKLCVTGFRARCLPGGLNVENRGARAFALDRYLRGSAPVLGLACRCSGTGEHCARFHADFPGRYRREFERLSRKVGNPLFLSQRPDLWLYARSPQLSD